MDPVESDCSFPVPLCHSCPVCETWSKVSVAFQWRNSQQQQLEPHRTLQKKACAKLACAGDTLSNSWNQISKDSKRGISVSTVSGVVLAFGRWVWGRTESSYHNLHMFHQINRFSHSRNSPLGSKAGESATASCLLIRVWILKWFNLTSITFQHKSRSLMAVAYSVYPSPLVERVSIPIQHGWMDPFLMR